MKRYPRQRVQKLIDTLIARPSRDDCYNPYCEPELAGNLSIYLEASWRHPDYCGLLLVGEALGYKGGRHTGVPFSSRGLLHENKHPFLQHLATRLRLPHCDGHADSEATASIVWGYLQGRRQLPLFWNAFPYHPHLVGQPDSNRKPRATEMQEGAELLQQLIAIFRPTRRAGIGRQGHSMVSALSPGHKVSYVRHPSYGGKIDFIAGMDKLVGHEPST